MPYRVPKFVAAVALGALIVAALAVEAQEPKGPIPLVPPGAQPQPDPNAPPEGAEVLARGPVHEAFATTAEAPTPEPVVAKQPPEPIEELPPDQKPEGDNVQWIPGYWDWDEENERFFWISGCWRDTPPGRLWVPGSWRQVVGGWQWVSGFWQQPEPEQPTQPQLTYLSEPPQTLEVGPSVAAPTATSFYVPGSWVWRHKYVWRPGVWVEYRPNWIWVPAHYRWTPLGYVFCDGYWDYTLAERGVLFAPIVFTRPVRPAYVYTPVYVVSEPALVGALFVRRGRPHYYFGDYFEPRYVNRGFNPWAGRVTGVTFTVGYGTGRTWGYDPLWSHYSVARRTDRDWNARVNTLYTGRYTGNVARPPVTLVQQNTVINKITNVNVTNVTNNITVVNNTTNNTRQVTVNNQNVTDVAMIAPVSFAPKLQPEARIKPVTAEVRQAEAKAAKEIRQVAVQRTQAETAAVAKLPPPPKIDPKQPAAPPAVIQPQTLKLEVPKAVAARAQISKDEKKAPPPPAIKVDTKVEPKTTPKVEPKGVPDPKVTPVPMPKVEPKVEPKPKDPAPVPLPNPKVEPKPKDPVPVPMPKVEPKPKDPVPAPKTEPKVEPKPEPKKVEPVPLPKVEPKKVDPVPVPMPKVEPKKVDPAPVPLPNPKVEPKPKEPLPAPKPKDPPAPVPPPAPKVEPKAPAPPAPPPAPKVEPKAPAPPAPPPAPKVEPKAEPKKADPPEPKKGEPKKKDPSP